MKGENKEVREKIKGTSAKEESERCRSCQGIFKMRVNIKCERRK